MAIQSLSMLDIMDHAIRSSTHYHKFHILDIFCASSQISQSLKAILQSCTKFTLNPNKNQRCLNFNFKLQIQNIIIILYKLIYSSKFFRNFIGCLLGSLCGKNFLSTHLSSSTTENSTTGRIAEV